MPSAKQLSLLKEPRRDTKLWWIVKQSTYGGSMNYRKVARPFDSKKLTHAVFKARLGSALRFTKSTESIRKLLDKVADACDVKIKDWAINHDHIHLLFSAKAREDQARFLRLFAAEMGRKYKTLRRKFGVRSGKSMWLHRPFTRLVSWGKKSLANVEHYFDKNRKEALGFIEYTPRKHRLSMFLKRWEARFLSSA
jgi:REP element-mobilizing transposase RayT